MAKPVFKGRNATDLLRYAERILMKMMENEALFTDPVPDLATFEGSLNAYRDAYAEATFRDKRAVVLKGQKGTELQALIYRLSHYVDAVAEGDPAVILAAGYRVARSTTNRYGGAPKAENLRVQHVQVGSGVIRLRVKPWPPARLYRYEYRLIGGEVWTEVLHSKATLELEGLDMFQKYEFRVSYLGRDTVPNFSDAVTAWVV